MADDTFYPAEVYPGGSEADFRELSRRTIAGITQRHHRFVERLGWNTSTTVLEKLALIASEVGEAVNECRGPRPTEKFPAELADIVLRTLDLAACQGINLTDVILAKMEENDARYHRGEFAAKVK